MRLGKKGQTRKNMQYVNGKMSLVARRGLSIPCPFDEIINLGLELGDSKWKSIFER